MGGHSFRLHFIGDLNNNLSLSYISVCYRATHSSEGAEQRKGAATICAQQFIRCLHQIMEEAVTSRVNTKSIGGGEGGMIERSGGAPFLGSFFQKAHMK